MSRAASAATDEPPVRLRIAIRGAVQGVGFRPFIYRLAHKSRLAGWINNSSQGVFIEVEGRRDDLERFLLSVEREKPPRSFIQSLESSFLDPVGYQRFEIRESESAGDKTALVLPDIATCGDCLCDLFDPDNRRYMYPFTNCTNCGPRFTILEALPYDRPNTTMKQFEMCSSCREEYHDPTDRRFHAQPNACPECGPHLELWDALGAVISSRHDALVKTAAAIRDGAIAAVKGLGGFHLMVDARNEEAVCRLRWKKHREEKPLALMFPTLAKIQNVCDVSDLERRLLLSPESPIVLLKRKAASRDRPAIAPSVAPGNPYLGVMLPYTPLHYLLLAELGFPIVATSGNLSDEPICIDEHEALKRLGGIADIFLVHDRPIARHVDDSILRVMGGRELMLRRARGYAPLPVRLRRPSAPALSVGAHLKNSVATAAGQNAFISQHIGDLETPEAFGAFLRVVESFKSMQELEPRLIACDLHPAYLSTQYAHDSGFQCAPVQHHYAHILSCMAENDIEGPVLGVAWDGTGYGLDGTIWGGEFLRVPDLRDSRSCACVHEVPWSPFQRVAHFRTFQLPGGDNAIKEPRRAAVGALYEIFGESLFEMKELSPLDAFSLRELALLRSMLSKHINSPVTSSAGRLFDAVAAISGLRRKVKFEGQAAMELEFALDGANTDASYPFELSESRTTSLSPLPLIFDWAPIVRALIKDVEAKTPVRQISAQFHNSLVELILAVARRIGEERVALSGGCFQNKYLTERAVRLLKREGFRPYWHQRVPPNDGGIALGQIVAASIS